MIPIIQIIALSYEIETGKNEAGNRQERERERETD